MKHNLKVTFVILAMFITAQFLGLYAVNYYQDADHALPYGLDTPEVQEQAEYNSYFYSIVIAFTIAVILLFLITKFKLAVIMRVWFFTVILIALGLFINTLIPDMKYASLFALIIALPLTLSKLVERNLLVHNITELMIYPGIAAIFVAFFNIYTVIALLILISIYDAWAVWHSRIMQKMVKFQIDKLKIFSGFFVPYASKKVRLKIKQMKKKGIKDKKIKVNVALLGGGDVIFPIVTSGIMLITFGFWSAIATIFGAVLGLSYLFFLAEKRKSYPAMPFITAGMFLGMLVSYLFII